MKNIETTRKIKDIRNRKGFSQEELAEKSGLSLRTIQRIESGKTEPLGDSLKKIANALEVDLDELVDWAIQEDKVFLSILNLSSLSFLLFPLLGILIPYFMWNSKRNKVRGINELGASLVNFQLSWNLLLFLGVIVVTVSTILLNETLSIKSIITGNLRFCSYMYAINFLLILFNASLLRNNKPLKYYPKIKFL